jgi:tetratricopeptide (TPR) repeat protein
MIRLTIVCAYSCLFLGTIFGILCGGVSFTRGHRKRYPSLRRLDGQQIPFAICTIAFFFLTTIAFIVKEFLTLASPTEVIQGTQGELLQKATISGFERELEDAGAERQREAKAFFEAAERDFVKQRYGDAARGYQKSLEALPTMAAYLNLGASLYYVSDFRKAEEALIGGLRQARGKGNQQFEVAFLDYTGIVYGIQGKPEEALESLQKALALSKKIGDRLGEASILQNIGIIYRSQGKPEEALKSSQTALTLFREIGNHLGEGQYPQQYGPLLR